MGVQQVLTGCHKHESSVATQTESRSKLWSAPPEEIRLLIRSGVVSSRLVFPENGPPREVVVWRAPVVRDRALVERVRVHLTEVEACLEPTDRGALLARILALLSHYRVEPQPQQIEMMMANDWAEDLGDYPGWAIDAAARRWRRTKKFKPQICEMIALCEEACGESRVHRGRLRAILDATYRQAYPIGTQIGDLAAGILSRMPAESWD